jgi:hypothetical protein
MPVSTVPKNNVQGTLVIRTGSGRSLTMDFDRGDIAWSDIRAVANALVKIQARGKRKGIAHGDVVYPKVSGSMYVTNLVSDDGSAPGSPLEIMTGKGAYAVDDSTSGVGTGTPWTTDWTLTINGSDVGDGSDEVITWSDCDATGDFKEDVNGNLLSFALEVCGPVDVVNGSNTVTYDTI